MNYQLIHHPDFSRDMDRLHEGWQQDRNSPTGREFQAAMAALRALREEREGEYQGKQLGYGPQSYDLRDCAELKVPVDREFTPGGFERGPSHRLIYREFDPLPVIKGDRVVQDPNAQPYRQPIAFTHRLERSRRHSGEALGPDTGYAFAGTPWGYRRRTSGHRAAAGRRADDTASDSSAWRSAEAGADPPRRPAGRHGTEASRGATGERQPTAWARFVKVEGTLTGPRPELLVGTRPA